MTKIQSYNINGPVGFAVNIFRWRCRGMGSGVG